MIEQQGVNATERPEIALGSAASPRIYGQPLLEIPTDLFIPPEALHVFLEAFEGPLDLLLYLIRRQNLNILDIPMAELTKQYMEYVDLMRQTQLELAAEYLLMAALLIDIKSRLLLPKPPVVEAEEQDPRVELARRLLEYEQMKLAAQQIDALPQIGRDLTWVQVWVEKTVEQHLPQVRPEDLLAAWQTLLAKVSVQNRRHLIKREELSVRSRMTKILRDLPPGRYTEFLDLFRENATVPELVVTFLAVLELVREQMVKVTQAEVFAPIYVWLAAEPLSDQFDELGAAA